jgi:hypothetical membrane protein
MRQRTFQIATVVGIMEPVFYFVLISALSFIRPNYNLTKRYISELSGKGSPHLALSNFSSFMLLGVALIFAGSALHDLEKDFQYSQIAHSLILITGVSFILLGVFPADSYKAGKTLTGKLHRLFTFPAALAMPGAMLVYSRIFEEDKRWKRLWPNFSAFSAWLILAAGWLLYNYKNKRYSGIVQRIAMGPALAWMSAVSTKMRLLHN